jgi:hypothetical protein
MRWLIALWKKVSLEDVLLRLGWLEGRVNGRDEQEEVT